MNILQSRSQSTLWRNVAVGIILGASLLYLHGFRGVLPYYVVPDEAHFYVASAEIRTVGHVMNNPFYPPLRPYEMATQQTLINVMSGGSALPMVYAVFARATSAFYGLLLLAVLYRIGQELHSQLAGLLAVCFLALDPSMLSFTRVARGDTLSWLLIASVILGTLYLLRHETKRRWLFTVLCAAGAFLAKYTAAPIWLLPGYLILERVFPRPVIRWSIVIAGIVVVVAFVLVARANPDAWRYVFVRSGFGFLLEKGFSFQANLLNSAIAAQDGLGEIWILAGVSLLPMLLIAGRARFTSAQLALLALLAGSVAGTALVFTLTAARHHDAYVAVLIWTLFGSVTLALAVERWGRLALIAVIALVGIFNWPKVVSAWEMGEQSTQPHTLAALGEWFRENVPQGGRVVVEAHTPFNEESGFPGRQQMYHQYKARFLFKETIEAYRERGYEFAIWSAKATHEPLYSNPDVLANLPYFAGTQEVLYLSKKNGYQGPTIVVFRIPPIQQHPLYVWLTPAISFRGYDLNGDTFKPGDELQLMLYWESAEKTEANYIVFVHVLDSKTGQLLVGKDGPPDYGNTPTPKWQGDMQFIRDQRILTIPADAAPGAYTLRIGMYEAATQSRVQILDLNYQPTGDVLVLQEITVEK